MSKRFWKMETFDGFCDIIGDKTICSVRLEYADNLVNLLNSLSEENEQLRKQNEEIMALKWVKKYILSEVSDRELELEKENEQLRKQVNNLEEAIEKTAQDMSKLDIYLGDFDICSRITEYVRELNE